MGHQEEHDKDRRDTDFVHADPVTDQALDWFCRLRAGDADRATQSAFEAWLSEDPGHAAKFRDLELLWNSRSFINAVQSLPDEPRVAFRPRTYRWPARIVALAASVLLAVGVWQYPSLKIAYLADYSTSTGTQTKVTLPDGSTVMLNTDTALALDFKGGQRHVDLLRGEAFFDVVHDPAHPFIVNGQYGEVQVLGTAFAVRTGHDEDEVVLERGHVRVSCLCAGKAKAELAPGDAVSVTASAILPVQKIDPSTALSWREGRIVFEDASLGEVLTELRRYHSGAIVVANDRLNHLKVTGNYRLDDIEGALKTLADAADLGFYRIPGGLIILQ